MQAKHQKLIDDVRDFLRANHPQLEPLADLLAVEIEGMKATDPAARKIMRQGGMPAILILALDGLAYRLFTAPDCLASELERGLFGKTFLERCRVQAA